jgi:hypothetical protein
VRLELSSSWPQSQCLGACRSVLANNEFLRRSTVRLVRLSHNKSTPTWVRPDHVAWLKPEPQTCFGLPTRVTCPFSSSLGHFCLSLVGT